MITKYTTYIKENNNIDYIDKENSNIFNNEYFVDIIKNNDYLYNKYRYYINANNFDIL